jgi:hypothetical protein
MNRKTPAADRFTFDLSPKDRVIVDVLRDYILGLNNEIEETFKYQCPFYMFKGMFCYITFDKKNKIVALGFVKGYKLEDKFNILSTDRKQIRKLHFRTAEEIDDKILKYYFKQAVALQK